MAQGEYKIDEAIEVFYQAPNALSGKIVQMQVYDGTHAAYGVLLTLTEIGASGRYYGTFTPDAEGNWAVTIQVDNGTGKVIKHYPVVGHNIDSVGDSLAALVSPAMVG